MGFIGVYKAVYDYAPQAEGELQITEGDILYVIEKSGEDDWWRAKKKASADDDDEPVGLVPNNYVEEAQPLGHARALYEYTRQTDEELSFPEDAQLAVYDTSDPDWILVGYDGDFGFAPANYIDLAGGVGGEQEHEQEQAVEQAQEQVQEEGPAQPPRPVPTLPAREVSGAVSPPLPPRNAPAEPSSAPVASGPAAALANVMAGRSVPPAPSAAPAPSAPPAQPRPTIALPPRPSYASDESEEDPKSPPLPSRPRGSSYDRDETTYSTAVAERDPYRESYRPPQPEPQRRPRPEAPTAQTEAARTPDSFHMYNISEMVSIMGKKKKMPTTLGVNLKTGVILIAPEYASDGPSLEWTADKMTHYSREGKHVFMELVRPSKSVDFHAGAKDTAEEIVAMLGELAGAVRAEGLREVIMAGRGGSGAVLRKGVVLYDFMAQGEDEVTVAAGDEVVVVDDSKSEEWWQVRRVKNGSEGVVPSSYIEITGTISAPAAGLTGEAAIPESMVGINAGRSTVEQNRLEEQRLTKEAIRAGQREDQKEREREHRERDRDRDRERDRDRGSNHNDRREVGPGMRLPDRNSSLSSTRNGSNSASKQRSRRENGDGAAGAGGGGRGGKSKPDASKVRTWTDRSKSFSVEAQFLALKDGKLHLHKMNGVKIAVPVVKMSLEDLEYVERLTGQSLDEDKPLSGFRKSGAASASASASAVPPAKVGATVEQPRKPEYDWFQFFLSCDVAPGLCERYATAFTRDSMDESVLPDVDASVLRNLGLREGDIIKVMRFLDNKYRSKKEDGDGGLFSGPGGALRNNTRKGRPAPAIETNNVVDAKSLSAQKDGGDSSAATAAASPSPAEVAASTSKSSTPTPAAAASSEKKPASGFEDDAWDIKPSLSSKPKAAETTAPEPTPAAAVAAARAPEPAPAAPAPPPASKPAALTGSMQELSLLTQPLQPEKALPPIVSAPPALSLAPATQPATSPGILSAPAQPALQPQLTGATPMFFSGMQQQQQQQPQPTGLQAAGRARPGVPQYAQGPGGGLLPPPAPARSLSAPQSAQPSVFPPPPLQPQMTGYQQAPPQQLAPAGQSLGELAQVRLQQQYAQQMQQQQMQQQQQQQQQQPMMPMMTGMQVPPQGFGVGPSPFIAQPTGMLSNGIPQQQQQFGAPLGPLQMQPTGFATFTPPPVPPIPQQQQQQQPQYGGGLPPPLEPQRTGMPSPNMPPQPTGFNGAPTMPVQPLVPQQTGPPPPVRFGVSNEPKKLAPQPTGRRANLAQATPQNPFGF